MQSIGALLTRLHDEAQRLGVPEVVIDFREFDFMNSSCFKAFVTWIGNVQESEKQYRIRFLSDVNKHWQLRSLEALRCFAVDLIRVET
jgi:anti-anti-sigma regulatory factor